MARPTGGYYVGQTRVPSVTTILGRYKMADPLIHWAWKMGMDGKDYREVRDEAANAGTVAHAMVEGWLKGQNHVVTNAPAETTEKAHNAFVQFREWAAQTKLTIVSTEESLVSPTHMFGGTLDAVSVKGERALVDWKTSNRVYPEYAVQLAAYGLLWNENHPDQPITGGYHLIRFDKENAAFSHHWWGDLKVGEDYFLALRKAYGMITKVSRYA